MSIKSFSGLSGTIHGLVAPVPLETPRQIAPQSLCLVFFWLRLFKLEDHLIQLLILQRRKARPGEMKGLAQDLRTKLGQFQDKNQDPWYWLHHSFPRLPWFSRLASKPLHGLRKWTDVLVNVHTAWVWDVSWFKWSPESDFVIWMGRIIICYLSKF